nr:hypothetical protein [Candidatus Aminicenantes bacterium]NIM84973.1 hypothetical protein [Candidatus Aminicenantes bacterium]NIN24487.1 hypothetical protein [Candidatus Aminicenantes bacterium]NIN48251.1 hypothetical protein [Candidatus Aminicenantes bacterium]NIN91154.1 hypothetical protein [Candidatus Aminicenantes bacterium]
MNKHSYLVFVFVGLIGLFLVYGSGEKGADITRDLDKRGKPAENAGKVKLDVNFGKIPLYFIHNKGQVNEKAAFYARTSRYTLWITKEGLVFDSMKRADKENPKFEFRNSKQIQNSNVQNSKQMQKSLEYSPITKYQRDVSRFVFINAKKNPEMVPVDETRLRVNYFKGNDRSKWHCEVPTSQAVLYKNLYKNID